MLDLTWNEVLLGLLVFVFASGAGAVITGAIVIRLPADYFSTPRQPRLWLGAHPILRGAGLVLKNLAGGLVVVFGVVLAAPGVPGPGVLTILIGMALMDFPGKRRLERWVIGRPGALDTVNRLRGRYGRPPLVL